MSDDRLRIYKGADKSFLIRLKSLKTDDPYALDGITSLQVIFINADRSKLVLTSDVRPSTRAFAEFDGTIFKSQENGSLGNNIHLFFNGVDTLAEVVDAWNSVNPANLGEHDRLDNSTVFPKTEIRLNGGYDAYTPVSIFGDYRLGKVNVVMSETETARLRSGANNSFSIIVDKGENVGGIRNIGTFEQKVDVKDSII